MDAALLWIQQKEKEKILAVSPIPTELNSDDIGAGTKGLTRSRLFGLLYMLKMVDGAGDRVGHEEYRELEHSERMRKGTQKVLKNKNLHVGLIWLPSNLESVAGAPTEEANSEGSDSWQWIWLVCTVVGALSLIEWLRRYLPKVIYMTWNYTEVAFSEMIRETTKYKSEEKGMDDKAAQTDNWVDFEALAHCEVERNEMENKVFQLDTYIEELESEICKVKEQRDMALQECLLASNHGKRLMERSLKYRICRHGKIHFDERCTCSSSALAATPASSSSSCSFSGSDSRLAIAKPWSMVNWWMESSTLVSLILSDSGIENGVQVSSMYGTLPCNLNFTHFPSGRRNIGVVSFPQTKSYPCSKHLKPIESAEGVL